MTTCTSRDWCRVLIVLAIDLLKLALVWIFHNFVCDRCSRLASLQPCNRIHEFQSICQVTGWKCNHNDWGYQNDWQKVWTLLFFAQFDVAVLKSTCCDWLELLHIMLSWNYSLTFLGIRHYNLWISDLFGFLDLYISWFCCLSFGERRLASTTTILSCLVFPHQHYSFYYLFFTRLLIL